MWITSLKCDEMDIGVVEKVVEKELGMKMLFMLFL